MSLSRHLASIRKFTKVVSSFYPPRAQVLHGRTCLSHQTMNEGTNGSMIARPTSLSSRIIHLEISVMTPMCSKKKCVSQ